MKKIFILVLMILVFFCGCGIFPENSVTDGHEKDTSAGEKRPISVKQLTTVDESDVFAEIKTSLGTLKVRLFDDTAPLSTANFTALAESGYYNGMSAERVFEDFVETGDAEGNGGKSIYLDKDGNPVPFTEDFSERAPHLYGAISMVRGEDGGFRSKFFIVTAKSVNKEALDMMRREGYPEEIVSAYEKHGGAPRFDYKFTVFGCVTEGFEVLESISVSAEPVMVESITVLH